MKKSRIIIQGLWGNIEAAGEFTFTKVRSEVKRAIQNKSKLNDYAVTSALGQDNYDFLKDCGAKNLILIDNRDLIQPSGIDDKWHKPYLVRKFLEEYKEVCFLDWDIKLNWRLYSDFDEEVFWGLIGAKTGGNFRSEIQATFKKWYEKFDTYWRYEDPKWIKLSKGSSDYILNASINTCMTYCRNSGIIDEWMSIFSYILLNKPKDYEKYVFLEEAAWNYYYDKLFPYSNVEKMFEDFGGYAVRIGRRAIIRKSMMPWIEKSMYFHR